MDSCTRGGATKLNLGRRLPPSLTRTERRVGSLLAAGYGDAEIATRLLLSTQSVEWSVAKLCRTLEVSSRRELVALLSELSRP
jgi:DNA-binding CsgD family transcriptional regulator